MIAIHCQTQKEWNEVIRREGVSSRLSSSTWKVYENKTCLIFEKDKCIGFTFLEDAPMIDDCDIIPASEYLKDLNVNTHRLKTAAKFYEAVRTGKKKFEIRKNDRDFHVGDLVVLEEIDKQGLYTRRNLIRRICYITSFAQQEGFVVFGIHRDDD